VRLAIAANMQASISAPCTRMRIESWRHDMKCVWRQEHSLDASYDAIGEITASMQPAFSLSHGAAASRRQHRRHRVTPLLQGAQVRRTAQKWRDRTCRTI